MAKPQSPPNAPLELQSLLLYHFCRMQLPRLSLSFESFQAHLKRTFALHVRKTGDTASWNSYLESLHALDWFLAVTCLERCDAAWLQLFASRAGRADCLLLDALRRRALRLYPGNEERQESAVTEFWSQLLVSEGSSSPPVLERYDGLRPLIPWLIRVFQNSHISLLRHRGGAEPLPDDEVAAPLPAGAEVRWHEAFCLAARDALQDITDNERLILGLRLRYRLSQREVAGLLGLHEGTVSRQTTQVRDRILQAVGDQLLAQGWAGDDLSSFVLNEMGALLLDEPSLSVARLAALLATKGKALPDVKSTMRRRSQTDESV